MKSHSQSIPPNLEKTYDQLRQKLAQVGCISDGSVLERPSGLNGSKYQWTRKVKGKTVCVSLSKDQFVFLGEAIDNWREMQKTIREMQKLSREILFTKLPEPPRRKRLSKKVLGIK